MEVKLFLLRDFVGHVYFILSWDYGLQYAHCVVVYLSVYIVG